MAVEELPCAERSSARKNQIRRDKSIHEEANHASHILRIASIAITSFQGSSSTTQFKQAFTNINEPNLIAFPFAQLQQSQRSPPTIALAPADAAAFSRLFPSISFLRNTLTCASVTREHYRLAPWLWTAAGTATTGDSVTKIVSRCAFEQNSTPALALYRIGLSLGDHNRSLHHASLRQIALEIQQHAIVLPGKYIQAGMAEEKALCVPLLLSFSGGTPRPAGELRLPL